MVAPGVRIDLHFPVTVVRDGVVKEVSFADLLTRRTVVSVYMKNNTGTCDRQNEALAANRAAIEHAGCDLIAVSRDTGASQLRYATKKQIGYPLVSDPDDRFAAAVDSLVQKSMYGRTFVGPARAAYLLAQDGTVLGVVPKIEADKHAEQVLGMIRAAS